MSAMTTSLRTCSLPGATLACMLFSGMLAAQDRMVTVAVAVSTQGLDLTQARDAQTFYSRLEKAARAVCRSGNRVDVEPVDNFQDCYEKALGGAVHSAKAPLITKIYLNNHTFNRAVAQCNGILAKLEGR